MNHQIRNLKQRTGSLLLALIMLISLTAGLPKMVYAEEDQQPQTLGNGTSYYVDAENGSDDNTGTTPAEAWKTFEPVNGKTFQPGDNILLKADCVWNDAYLWPKGSGSEDEPITIDMYGEGEKPRINTNGVHNTEAADNTSSCVRLKDQEYVIIRNLELTNHSDQPLTATGDLRPYEDAEAADGKLNRFPFGSGDYLVGILVTITAGQETDKVYHDITVEDCYIHDVNGLRMFHSPAMDGSSKLTWTRAWELGGFDTDLWKASGGIAFTTEDPRPRQTPETTSNSDLWGVPEGISNAMPPNTKDDGLHKAIYDGVLIQNNRIEDVSETGIRVMQSVHLRAYTLRQVDDPLAGLHKDVLIRNNYVNGGKRWSDFGIYWACTDRALVEHNTVSGFHTSGLEDTHAQFSVAQYNEVFDIQHDYSSGAYDENGVLQYTPAQIQGSYRTTYDLTNTADSVAIDSDGGSMGAIWQYNYLHDNRDGVLFCEWNGVTQVPTTVRYNIVTNTGYRLIYGGTPGYIYNNTFYNALDYGEVQIAGNEQVKNNIFFLPSQQFSYSGKALEANMYAGGLTAPAADTKAIVGDPYFTDPGKDQPYTSCIKAAEGYKIQAESPAIDAGVSIDFDIEREYNEGHDYFDQQITDGMPDIGAHEFSDEKISVERSLFLNSSNLYMTPGEVSALDAKVKPQCSTQYNYSSSEPGVAAVDEKGMITAVSEGTTEITVTATIQGGNELLNAVCSVNVYQPSEGTDQTLVATDDATVRAGNTVDDPLGVSSAAYPAGSLESRQTLYAHFADSVDYSRYSAIQFDASGWLGRQIPKAAIRLFLHEIRESNSVPEIGLYEAAAGWDEQTLTWNSAKNAGLILNAQPVAVWTGREVASITTVDEWVEFDITEWLNTKLSDPEWDGSVSLVLAHTEMITDEFLAGGYTFPTDLSRKQMYQFVTKEYVPTGGKDGDCAPQLVLSTSDFELITSPDITTEVGTAPALPEQVEIYMDGSEKQVDVTWESVEEEWYAKEGSFEVLGHIDGGPDIIFTVKVTDNTEQEESVSSIAILPNTDDIAPGKSRRFQAVVANGSAAVGGKVIWSVSGKTSEDTGISQEGILTVGEDETAESLTVTAESAEDQEIVQHAEVKVPKAALELNHDEIHFPAQPAEWDGYQKAEFVEIRNTGSGTVRILCELKDEKNAFRISAVPYTLTPGETTMLAVHAKKALEEGYYEASVDIYGDERLCQTLTVTLISGDDTVSIVEQPESVKAECGQDAVFEVAAAGNGLNYCWQIQKEEGTWEAAGESDGIGYDTERFTLTNTILEKDGWRVRCVVSNNTGKEVISDEVLLTVTRIQRKIPVPQVSEITSDKIVLQSVLPDSGTEDGKVQYGWASENDPDQVLEWKDVPVLEGLTPATGYWCFARVTGGSSYEDAWSEGVLIETKNILDMPSAEIDYQMENLINLQENAAYLINGESFTSSAQGTLALESGWFGQAITIIRCSSDSVVMDSQPQILLVPDRPKAPEVEQLQISAGATGFYITNGQSLDGCEFSLNGTDWQRVCEFTGLQPETTYTLWVRTAAVSGIQFASDAVKNEVTTTAQSSTGDGKPDDSETEQPKSGASVDTGDSVWGRLAILAGGMCMAACVIVRRRKRM